MAFLDDNSMTSEGVSFRVGTWIFIANGSGGFESCSSDRNPPEASEVASRHEFDDFIDRLEEIGISAISSKTRIQPGFDEFKTKILFELEEDLERLL